MSYSQPVQRAHEVNLAQSPHIHRHPWPDPFPTYVGRFVYAVAESNHPGPLAEGGQKGLGDGAFLWQLQIKGETVKIDGRNITCDMEKKLIELPSNAGSEYQKQRGRYIIEKWEGSAEPRDKTFKLTCDGTAEPARTNIDFGKEGMELSRPVLAGEYEMALVMEDSFVKAVHSSWVAFAHLDPCDAMGYLFRIDPPSMCKNINPPNEERVMKNLARADDMLKDHLTYEKGPRYVCYKFTKATVSTISTMSEEWSGEVRLELLFPVSKVDVFESLAHKDTWLLDWEPKPFQVSNCAGVQPERTESRPELAPMQFEVSAGVHKSFICAKVLHTYRGAFSEPLELHHFPFDVQWLHAKFEAPTEENVRWVKDEHERYRPQDVGWRSNEWIKLKWRSGHRMDESNGRKILLVCGIKARRKSTSYVSRVIAILCLIVIVSFSVFALDPVNDVGDRLGLIFTMMLTAASYSNAVGSMVPALGYATLLDHYIFGVFIAMFIIALEIAFVSLVGHDLMQEHGHDAHEWDSIILRMDIAALTIMHIIFIGYVIWWVGPEEKAKDIDLDDDSPQDGEVDMSEEENLDHDANTDSEASDDATSTLLSRSRASQVSSRTGSWSFKIRNTVDE